MKATTSDGTVFEGTPQEMKEYFVESVLYDKLFIDWKKIPPEYNYAAMDTDGTWYVFHNQPYADIGVWWSDGDITYDHLSFFCKPPEYDGDWEYSLVSRAPTGE